MPLIRSIVATAVLLPLFPAAHGWQGGWQANPEIVRKLSEKQPQFEYDEARVPAYTLPDALGNGAAKVRTADEWPRRRAEILELFREHVYGRRPGPPARLAFEVVADDPRALNGSATLKRVAILSSHAGRDHRFELTLFLPNAAQGPVPVFLLLNNRPLTNTDASRGEQSGFWPAEEVVARGYGIAAIQNNDLAPDDKDRFRAGVIRLFEGATTGPRPENAWAALSAWGWGASRAMDYFERDARVDAKRVAVLGHSRGGKAALWAGAEDERFALVISNESGEGGAALTRRHYGETLARITTSFPHWFAGRYAAYASRVDALPVDQHMLLALMAPRAVYVASADEDLWADPRGEFLSLAHASPVFALWGDRPMRAEDMPPLDRPLVAGRRAYHVRTGGHNLTPYDWQRYMDFADALWRRGTPRSGAERQAVSEQMDGAGRTPLTRAAADGRLAEVTRLLRAGAAGDAQDSMLSRLDGWIAQSSRDGGAGDGARLLRQAGARPYRANANEQPCTPAAR